MGRITITPSDESDQDTQDELRVKWHKRPGKQPIVIDLTPLPPSSIEPPTKYWTILKAWDFQANGHEAAAKIGVDLPRDNDALVFLFADDVDALAQKKVPREDITALPTTRCWEHDKTRRFANAPLPPAKRGILVLASWKTPTC
jgi:hypothetical protein